MSAPLESAARVLSDLDIILPGTWFWFPLDDDAELTKRVTEMVKRQLGRSDRLATKRREGREQVVAVARDAKAAGAVAFAMAVELAPGVPFPASLMMRFDSWVTSEAADVASRLRVQVPEASILDQRTGPVARVATFFEQQVEDESTPTLRCEYWLPVPNGSGVLNVTISAPTVPEPTLFTELFDSMIDSITWSGRLERVDIADD